MRKHRWRTTATAIVLVLVGQMTPGARAIATGSDNFDSIGIGAANGATALSVADAVTSTRVEGNVTSWRLTKEGQYVPIVQSVLVSPDGSRYAVRLVRGDLQQNGDWIEVITGRLDSMRDARKYRLAVKLFSTGLGGKSCSEGGLLTLREFNPMLWSNSHSIAFLYKGPAGVVEAVAVDLQTGKTTYLTHSDTDVVSFDVGDDGTVIYTAKRRHTNRRNAQLLKNGFVVKSTMDAFALLDGHVDGYSVLDSCYDMQEFVVRPHSGSATLLKLNRQGFDRWRPQLRPAFSHDDSMVVLEGSPSTVPVAWGRYGGRVMKEEVREAQRDLYTFYARGIEQLFVVNVRTGETRTVWNCPSESGTKVAWSWDDSRIVIGPTYLPEGIEGREGYKGGSVAVVDVETGAGVALPVSDAIEEKGITDVGWSKSGVVVVRAGDLSERFRESRGQWTVESDGVDGGQVAKREGIEVILRQSMNSWPVLVGKDRITGEEDTIFDLNPVLRRKVTLGKVVSFRWSDGANRAWYGRLYYPVGYKMGRRYPLVIQTHGLPPSGEFSLYGIDPGLGPGVAVYAAQELAGRGIAVLQVQDKEVNGAFVSPREPELYAQAYVSGIRKLSQEGVVDRERVGIMGYSRTGWGVEYALTQSSYNYAAAVIADGMDPSYLNATLNWIGEYTMDIGASPFGAGLEKWFLRAPGFRADGIHCPLMLVATTGPLDHLLSHWELFARLRQLHRPVEFAVIPDIENGSHAPQNPKQAWAAQSSVVAWFDFWLNGREEDTQRQDDRYIRWRELRRLYKAENQTPIRSH